MAYAELTLKSKHMNSRSTRPLPYFCFSFLIQWRIGDLANEQLC